MYEDTQTGSGEIKWLLRLKAIFYCIAFYAGHNSKANGGNAITSHTFLLGKLMHIVKPHSAAAGERNITEKIGIATYYMIIILIASIHMHVCIRNREHSIISKVSSSSSRSTPPTERRRHHHHNFHAFRICLTFTIIICSSLSPHTPQATFISSFYSAYYTRYSFSYFAAPVTLLFFNKV